MLIQSYATQPVGPNTYSTLFKSTLTNGTFSHFDVAVAYATLSGVTFISPFIRPLDDVKKRWLVGIDWCRSEPLALDRLALMPNSIVKIHDGYKVVRRRGCVPLIPFHPKSFIFRGRDSIAVIAGSGNLSRNGLSRGHELGTSILVKRPLSTYEKTLWRNHIGVSKWFDKLWANASELNDIRADYLISYERTPQLSTPTPVDDDVSIAVHHTLSPLQLQKLRACRHLWIEAGNLHHNRGVGRPGNQLMLTPMTRVFFGFPATDVPRDTRVGYVTLKYGSYSRPDCSLRYSNNSMDVLTLPVPGSGGPVTYDQETILFQKEVDSSGTYFVITVGTGSQVTQWIQQSTSVSGSYRMTSGRRWGVF